MRSRCLYRDGQGIPQSTFVGFDYHEPSMRHAHHGAVAAGVTKNTTFEVAKAKEFPGYNLSLVSIACARQGQQAEWAQSLRNVAAAFPYRTQTVLGDNGAELQTRRSAEELDRAVPPLDWLCHPDKSPQFVIRDP